jgi:ATP-dependent Clp protease ATP-binding subunit ClpA
MTQNRRSKQATRSRMAQTGEKYTEARRAVLASGGAGGGAGDERGVTIFWPDDSFGWFTDQAKNLILLAEDEARMLSHGTVEPEHLLLAVARHGNAERLLGGEAVARAIHDCVLRIQGFGDKLELRPQRTPTSEAVLRRAVLAAAARGVLGPSTEYLLFALGEQDLCARILAELGITDVQALVDAHYPVERPPLPDAIIQRRAAQLTAGGWRPPMPGPIPPIFERFTSQARDAIDAGIEHGREANSFYVEPIHLLYGVLDAKTGVVASLRARYGWDLPAAQVVESARSRATDIFSKDARRVVAEDVLIVSERLDRRALTSGHLLIALLESDNEIPADLTRALPELGDVATAVIDPALDGQED